MRKAKCNCLKSVEKKVKKQLTEVDPDYKHKSGAWQNTFKSPQDGSDELPYMNFCYEKQNSKMIHIQAVLISHCPFCGMPYHVENNNKNNGKS